MSATPPRSLDVLVPQGRDAHIDFAGGVPMPGEAAHEPINFHAIAAATGGEFHASVATVKQDHRAILVLIPRRVDRAMEAVRALKIAGHTVLVTWKECGSHQLAAAMSDRDHVEAVRKISEMADAWFAASPAAADVITAMVPAPRMITLPTPYPVDVDGWLSTRALAARDGIFIGTREWSVPARRHGQTIKLAVELARRHPGLRVTCVNTNGMLGRLRLARAAGRGINIHAIAPLAYPAYLDCIRGHRLVLQRDASGVPGQVAGDAILAGTPCLGGGGMIDRLVYPHLPGAGDDDKAVINAADHLLTVDAAWQDCMANAMRHAMESVSFAAFRRQWQDTSVCYPDR